MSSLHMSGSLIPTVTEHLRLFRAGVSHLITPTSEMIIHRTTQRRLSLMMSSVHSVTFTLTRSRSNLKADNSQHTITSTRERFQHLVEQGIHTGFLIMWKRPKFQRIISDHILSVKYLIHSLKLQNTQLEVYFVSKTKTKINSVTCDVWKTRDNVVSAEE